ncbi:hypothetical protein KRE47_07910 [Elizabethkingia meningoseptica]|nr:DUF6794 domain-containing protein [Elizabethkingia meningoseptica]MDE5467957.1 hypothetical protein [Elizabethkingia meningoseptica]MDE5478309.1 hypothetical protein [Elizabethkingia meningoseptica]MDE5486708.1 hypothetical protein [Elizabethkingia meningoseptica]MDE5501699.1 hypothetical protein [Elizabethkingia meningoseptica]MDE5512233.1 hypothetical protein [Elizabethkingia meningoseptica]
MKFKLTSLSYDKEVPNLKGESFVNYADEHASDGKLKSFYKINRSFDLFYDAPFFVAISNDGRKIIYITDNVYYPGEEYKNITVYLDGKLTKTYTTEEFTNCDLRNERCGIFYKKRDQLFNYDGATFLEYNDKASDQDKFLNKNYVFNKNDTIHIIDSRKKVTLFDLNNLSIIQSKIDFDSIYPKIKNIQAKPSHTIYYSYYHKNICDIEDSQSNKKLSQTISEMSGLKFISLNSREYHKFKMHKIYVAGYMNRSGKIEIDSISADPIFDLQKIINYINNTTFKTDFIPSGPDKVYVDNFYGGYRSFDDKIAEEETLKEKERKKDEFKKRLTLVKIDGFYIPKNLYECNVELDRLVNTEDKKELIKIDNYLEFNHFGLGMWIRNNWGINGGSRLLKYFHDRNIGKEVFGNDTISGIIIEQYIKWLKGDKKAWEKWEKQNPAKKN